ncbi:MAG: hypothetical protein BA865_09340 [Desulfobacterales bacterium S5133MH4]|nr:MAG: hypothetical protein BA865_09340 [Desulfobacterales bacterium S5133MH4]
MIPKLDGYELCHRFKADENTKYIPVLMLTAKSDVEDTVKGLDMGAGHHLAKSFDHKELSARVTSLLDLGEMVNCALYSRSTSENFGLV